MESRDRAAEELGTEGRGSGRTSLRLVAATVLLTSLAFVQSPGLEVADTKFDLVVDPARFLAGALHMWDPQATFGQLQNQAYGYLWPMGPFFLLGSLLDVPGWVVQRAWLALVLCVAFLGMARLARALGVRSDVACILAGFAYALSPRMLTVLGPISIEGWPSALAPWVLLPLVRGATWGSPRAAAARSALAVAMVGGVNAAATLAVVPAGALWLLTRKPGVRRRAMLLWWPVLVLLGTAWWIVPLLLLGRYSPPFLDFIETTSVTTFPTTVFDALRGTSNWVPYVTADSRAGNELISSGYLALNSGVVLFLGFVGLLQRRNRHRLFLAMSLLLGLLMVTAGHVGTAHGVGADWVRTLLDGPLSALRNVHKFDPLIRLPLVLGLAFAVDLVGSRGPTHPATSDPFETLAVKAQRPAFLALSIMVVAAASLPTLEGRLTPASATLGVPQYWRSAADWLGRHATRGTALLIPGSPSGAYSWGTPRDEPLQSLATMRWAVRDQIPLTPPGTIRMLDAIEQELASGSGSAALTSYLRRAGVTHLVVRNDLSPRSDVPDPLLVHQALAHSPGVDRVATFGPKVGGGAYLMDGRTRVMVDSGWQADAPAVEIYGVEGANQSAHTSAAPPIVMGGPEDLLGLQQAGLLDSAPTVLASDLPPGKARDHLDGSPLIATDGLRARERSFARLHDGYSPVLTRAQAAAVPRQPRDFLHEGQDRWTTFARYRGASDVSASSSAADADSPGGSDRGEAPYAALDSDPLTQWVSGSGDRRPWWKIVFDTPRAVLRLRLTGGASAEQRQAVRIVTEHRTIDRIGLAPGETRVLDVTGRETRWLKIQATRDAPEGPMALAGVSLPGMDVTRMLQLPRLPSGAPAPQALLFRADLDPRHGCVEVFAEVRCSASKVRHSEEPVRVERLLSLSGAASYLPQLTVSPRPGPELNQLLQRGQPVQVVPSSLDVPDPRASGFSAIDGDRGTTWLASAQEIRPSLTLGWPRPQRITSVTVSVSRNAAARAPSRITFLWPGGQRRVRLDERGFASFPAIRTAQLRVRVDQAQPVKNLDPGSGSEPPIGVGELRLGGAAFLPLTASSAPVDLGCGSGPDLDVNGTRWPTSVSASERQLYALDSLMAKICVPKGADNRAAFVPAAHPPVVTLTRGQNDVVVRHSAAFDMRTLALRAPRFSPGTAVSAPMTHSGTARLEIDPAQPHGVVALPMNTNPGWRASQGGHSLVPVVADGWQQAWLLRSGANVVAKYGPDVIYRYALLCGAFLLLLLIALTLMGFPGGFGDDERLPSVEERSTSGIALTLLGLLTGVLVASWWGLVVAALAFLLSQAGDRRDSDLVPWAVAATLPAAACFYLVRPWGSGEGWAGSIEWVQYLALLPVLTAVMRPFRIPRLRRRAVGSSTNR